jgi:hypothetical protein
MQVFKAFVASGNTVYKIDAIEHQGKLWLVSHWLDSPDKQQTTPGRIIRFDDQCYQDVRENPFRQADFALNDPIPKELLAVESPERPVLGFEYIEMPALRHSLEKKRI